MNKSALARAVGVSNMAVIYWEKNEIAPRQPTLSKVAVALDTSEEYLRTGKGDPGPFNQRTTADNAPLQATVGAVRSISAVLEETKLAIAAMAHVDESRVKLRLEILPD
jgi:transcriptional regulator with XRE-family HTH domain